MFPHARPVKSRLVWMIRVAALTLLIPAWVSAAPGRGAEDAQAAPVAATLKLTFQPSDKSKPTLTLANRVGESFDLSRLSSTDDGHIFTLLASGSWSLIERGNRVALELHRAFVSEQVPMQETVTTAQSVTKSTTYHVGMSVTTQTRTWINTDESTVLSDTDTGKLTITIAPIRR